MRLLILGAAGMLGHRLWLTAGPRVETWATVRRADDIPADGRFDRSRLLTDVYAEQFDTVMRAVAAVKPDVVVSCIGVVKQRIEGKDPIASLTINSLLPHRLSLLCRASGARLVHISTDCVFSGRSGGYRESDEPDAADLYGRTKQLGEVTTDGALTIRTSIIGRELRTTQGLVEWFLSQRGRAPGFTSAIFSGLTTLELSRVILRLIESQPDLQGLYHVAATAISKYDLLILLNRAFDLGLEIDPDDAVKIDRSLDGSAFQAATGYVAPDWPTMVAELAAESTPYDVWRARHAG